jgi:hypothetical protein
MEFKVIKKDNIRTPDGWITVDVGSELDLPDIYERHPSLEKIDIKQVKPKEAKIKIPKGLDRNNDGIVTDKEIAQHLGSKGGRPKKKKVVKK